MTTDAGEIRYFILADRAVPYLLARVRWADVAQAISAGGLDWVDDIGLFDLPYNRNSVTLSFTQAASVTAGWGLQLQAEPAVGAPSFIRRMPANWSDLTPEERRAFGLKPAAARRGMPARRLRRIQSSHATVGAPVPVAALSNGHGGTGQPPSARHRVAAGAAGPGAAGAERRRHVRVPVDGRAHIRSGQSTLSAPLVDLSESGMHCVLPGAPVMLPPGQRLGGPVVVESEAGNARICLAVPARISWVLDGRSGTHFGVTFGDLDEGEIEGVQHLLVTAGSRGG